MGRRGATAPHTTYHSEETRRRHDRIRDNADTWHHGMVANPKTMTTQPVDSRTMAGPLVLAGRTRPRRASTDLRPIKFAYGVPRQRRCPVYCDFVRTIRWTARTRSKPSTADDR